MAEQLKFESGIKEYPLKLYEEQDPVPVRFNPTNMLFIEHVFDCFDKMDKVQEKYVNRLETLRDDQDYKAVFAFTREMEQELRSGLNEVFYQDISTPLFGQFESVYAAADGLPIWANILLAVIDEFDDSFVREKQLQNPRLKKYIDKYRKSSK